MQRFHSMINIASTMRNNTNKFFVFLFLLSCLSAPLSSRAEKNVITEGERAPDFTLPDLKGNTYTLSSHLGEQKATLILIWGVWCPYCREIMVQLKKAYEKLHAQGMEIITISIRESPRKVALFTNKLNPAFVVLVDEWGDLKEPYQIKDVPRIVILNQDQKVKAMATTTSAEMVNDMIKTAIEAD